MGSKRLERSDPPSFKVLDEVLRWIEKKGKWGEGYTIKLGAID